MPGVTFGSTATVRLEVVAGGVIVAGRNLAVRPVGADANRSIGLLNPLVVATVIVEVLESPAVIVRDGGLGAMKKSGRTTVTLIVVLLERKPPVLVVLKPLMSTE